MDCKKAALLIDRNDWDDLRFREKLGLRIHNSRCGCCKGYERFSHILKSLFGDITKENKCLSGKEKDEMKKKFEEMKG